ncbi:alpha/beta fold hydrolase [Rhizomonospora bruguierae]|uniref:alpha/beta fold hydrolase n=1 Tax=Rhizomonospora bruguierae TaxID=1581705 RepID=UPI0035E4616C
MVPLLTGSHRVIRVDLLGCGQSAKPDGASYALPGQARARQGRAGPCGCPDTTCGSGPSSSSGRPRRRARWPACTAAPRLRRVRVPGVDHLVQLQGSGG